MITKFLKGPLLAALFISTAFAAEVSITIDDFNVKSPEGDQKILDALKKHHVQATLFVTCKYLENPMVKERLSHWEKDGHSIANHTYSHWFYDGKGFPAFSEDVRKCHDMIKTSVNFVPRFRFPFLKGGKTAEQRDAIQSFLKKLGYKNGYVTIDASDWFVSQKLEEALKKNPKTDIKLYRDYYLKHMWERSVYYDELGKKFWKSPLKHTVLIHHNFLNTLFLDDLIQMYKNKGWKIISSRVAFSDPLFDQVPDVVPHGESILWMFAKKAGDKSLRYPGEDAQFEENEMKKLGL